MKSPAMLRGSRSSESSHEPGSPTVSEKGPEHPEHDPEGFSGSFLDRVRNRLRRGSAVSGSEASHVSVQDAIQFTQEIGDVKNLEGFEIRGEGEEQEHLAELHRLMSAEDVKCPDDEFLILCLRVWQYSVPDAARVATNFARFRTKNGWPYRLSSADLQPELLSGVHWLLPGHDKLGRGLIVYNAKCIKGALEDGCTVESLQQMGAYLLEVAISRRGIPENGVVAVVDARGVGLKELLFRFPLAEIRRGVLMWKDAFPCKIKKIYVVGLSFAPQAVFGVCTRLMSAKLRQRIQLVSNDCNELANDVDLQNLPEELGGRMPWDWAGRALRLEQDDGAASSGADGSGMGQGAGEGQSATRVIHL